MKVYVVMGNDLPECVFDTLDAARKFCEARVKEDEEHNWGRKIYWRPYAFDLQSGESK